MEKLLNLITKTNQLAAWQWDLNRKEITVTAGFSAILCLKDSRTIFREGRLVVLIKRLLTEGQHYSLLESFRRCKEEKAPFTLSFLVDFKTIGKKWLKLMARPDIIEEQLRITGTLEDTTKWKQLQEQYQSASFINEEAPILFFLVNSNGIIIYANHHTCTKLGYSKSELLTTNIINHITQYSKRVWKQVWKDIRSSQNYTAERLFQRKDNTIFPARINGKFLHTPSGSYICYYAQDISIEQQQKIQITKLKKNSSNFELIQQMPKIDSSSAKIKKDFPAITTQDSKYLKVLENAQKGAATNTPILILGETGTGKELLADGIHRLSNRKTKPFIKVNCAALPNNLIESELFGYEKGAFTGADTRKPGRFELANEGSLFLDEIGELSISVQSKLLRVLQDGTFERIGGIKTIKVDVRIITATNQNLLTLVEQGQFRKDLYYRLNIFPVFSMALKERKRDIPLLAKHFLKNFTTLYNKPNLQLSKKQLAELMRYNYPGNIRELQAIIERAVILSSNTTLVLTDALQNPITIEASQKGFLTFEAMQRQYIIQVLEKTNWRVSGERGAAKLLDLNPNTLETKMRRLGIKRPK